MKKLYKFSWDCGRMGDLQGLFIAESSEIAKIIGEQVNFGEVLGKHSDIYGVLNEEDLTIKSEDQDFIAKFIEIMGDGTISGYNPLDFWEEDDEDEDWDEEE